MERNLIERLKQITASAYGNNIQGDIVLSQLTNEELKEMLDDLFENALATREFKKLGKDQHVKHEY